MKATILSGFVAGIHWFIPIVGATVTVTVRVPVGSCSAGGRSTFSDTATAITGSSPGISLVSPSPVPTYTPPTNGRSAIIVPSAIASNGCSYQYAACLQINQNTEPNQTFTETEGLTTEYCAAFCADYEHFGLQQGSFCYCGPVPPGYTVLDISACNQPCAGDTAQLCGQSSVIQEYSQVTCVRTAPASSTRPSGAAGRTTSLQSGSSLSITNAFTSSTSSSISGTSSGSNLTGVSTTGASSDLPSSSLSGSPPFSSFGFSLPSSNFSTTPTLNSLSTTLLVVSPSGSNSAASGSGQTSAMSTGSLASSISDVSLSPTNSPQPITINTTTTTSTTTTITMPPTTPTVLSSSTPPSSSPSSLGPSSVSVPTLTSTYALRLSRPTALSSVGDSETQYGLALPFSMSLYTTTDTQLTITTNGLLTIGNSASIYEAYADNAATPPNTLPAGVLNPGTAAVWWEYLQVVNGSSPEGVYYQIENNNAVYVEWLIEDAQGLVYQFIANYSTGSPGRMGFYYFATGDGGLDATIGIQGVDGDSAVTRAVEYMHGGNLSPGVLVEFDTNPQDTVVGVFSDTTFNLNCFPAGSFPAGIC